MFKNELFIEYKFGLEFSCKVTSAARQECLIIQIKCTGTSNIRDIRVS
jgi:hypothetical protein